MNKIYAFLCLAGGLLATRASGQSCNASFVDSVHGANLWVSSTQNSPTETSFWNFGDGQSAFGFSTTHTYNTPGTYTVTHIVQDSINQCTDSAAKSVTLQFTTCAVTFQAVLPAGQLPPEQVTFEALPSPGDPQGPKSYAWTIGDSVVSTLDSFSYTFTRQGQYFVTLTMHADSGCVASYNETISVANPDSCTLTASFSAYADSSNKLLYRFLATPADSSYSYNWSFGDGSFGTGSATSHLYSGRGIYTVTLAISAGHGQDSCSAQASGTEYVDSAATTPCYIVVRDSAIGGSGTTYAFLAQPSDSLLSQTWVITLMPDSNPIVTLHTNNPVYQFPDSGTYEISCTGPTVSGCLATGYAWVSINGDSLMNPTVRVPMLTSYPDPVRDQATIHLKLPGAAPVSITVFNAQGQPVGHMETSGVSGDNQITIPAGGLPQGMYFVHITSAGRQMQSRFQKQ